MVHSSIKRPAGSKKSLLFGLLLAALSLAGVLLTAKPAQAATLTVNTTEDDSTANGNCTLREAITAANTNAAVDGCAKGDLGADAIEFDIPADQADANGVFTISPTSQLPTITQTAIIDGYSQDGASPNTLARGSDAVLLIELNGQNAGSAFGLQIAGGVNSEVRGLAINRFGFAGISIGNNVINTAAVQVEGNFIGTDPSGTIDLGNAGGGVNIFGQGTVGNVVGGLARRAQRDLRQRLRRRPDRDREG